MADWVRAKPMAAAMKGAVQGVATMVARMPVINEALGLWPWMRLPPILVSDEPNSNVP